MKKSLCLLITCLIGVLLTFNSATATEPELKPYPMLIEQRSVPTDQMMVDLGENSQSMRAMPLAASAPTLSPMSSMIWGIAYGGTGIDTSDSFAATQDGGYIFAGETTPYGSTSSTIIVRKLNSTGGNIWAKVYGQGNDWYVDSVQETSDNGYIVSGTYSGTSSGSYLLKLDQFGNSDWSRTFLGEFRNVKAKPFANGYIVSCGYDHNLDGQIELVVFATDSFGNFQWLRILDSINYTSNYWDYVYSEVIPDDSNGTAAVFGHCQYTVGIGGYLTAYIVGSNSNIVASKEYSSFGGSDLQMPDVIRTNDGGYAMIKKNSFIGGHDLMKLDSDLDELWTQSFSITSATSGSVHKIKQTTDDGYIVTGSDQSTSSWNVLLIKFFDDGLKDWEYSANVINKDIPYFVHETTNGYVVGGTSYNGGDSQVFLVEYN